MNTVPNETDAPPFLLATRGVRKAFGGVEVLKGIDFEVRPGEVHALCGENGAGKTTLMNILAGVLRPDAGTLVMDAGTFAGFSDAHEAQRRGVSMVFQERSLFGPLTVAENIFAGRQPVRGGFIHRSALLERTAQLLAEVAPELRPDHRVEDLTSAQQQMVEIAKALSLEARVLILDEPTAALTESEASRLFALIGQLRGRGVGVIYISHRLEEVFRVSQRVTVLKDGAWQGTRATAATNPPELVRLMVGRDLEPRHESTARTDAPVLFEVRAWSDPPARRGFKPLLQNIELHARAGEVVGLAGLAGAGRSELALSWFGVRRRGEGELLVAGQPVTLHSPAAAIRAGLGYLGEDRKDSGLFLDLNIASNIVTAKIATQPGIFRGARSERHLADEFRQRLQINSRSAGQSVGQLSGGNQQKVFLARWLLVQPRILVVDEPTRGVDVGAKAAVHGFLYQFARDGGAVIVISSELPEILTVSDRIYVMRAGKITGELRRAEATEEAVMRLAA